MIQSLSSMSIHTLLQRTIIKLETKHGFGTGFYVGSQTIITCRHIAEQLSISAIDQLQILDINIAYNKNVDLALIKTNLYNEVCVWLDDEITFGDRCYCYSFTDDYPQGDSLTLEYEGEFTNGYQGLKFKQGQVRPGASGSPILNLRTGAVCGIMTKTRSRTYDLGGRALSSSEILKYFPEIQIEQINYHGVQNKWSSFLNSQQQKRFKQSFFSEEGLLNLVRDFLGSVPDCLLNPSNDGNILEKKYINLVGYASIIYDSIDTTDHICCLVDILTRLRHEKKEFILTLGQIEKDLFKYLSQQHCYLEEEEYPYITDTIIKHYYDVVSIKNALIYNVQVLNSETAKILLATKQYLYSRYITGSKNIKLSDLNSKTGLLIPFRWAYLDKTSNQPYSNELIDIIINSLYPDNRNYSSNYLILADPGVGKSTFINNLYHKLLINRLYNRINYVPFYLDLKKYVGDTDLGTPKWIDDYLDRILGTASKGESKQYQVIFIIDAFDEYIASLTLDKIDIFLSRYIFQFDCIVACRKQCYDRYLSQSEFSSRFEKVILKPWSEKMVNKYISQYVKYLKIRPKASNDIKNKIKDSAYLQELVTVPLRLNMLLDVMISDINLSDFIKDLLGLYNVYVRNWLKRESRRIGNLLKPEEKRYYLKLLSWYFYDEAILGSERQPISFTRQEMKNHIDQILYEEFGGAYQNAFDDLIERTLLIEEEPPNSVEPVTIKFLHKSFQEYFVANYLFDIVMDAPDKMAVDFQKFISPEVSEFLKECINRLNSGSKLKRFVENSILAFQCNMEEKNPRTRMARQQIAYYLGNIRDSSASTFLMKHINIEGDLWIKRGMIIGLSFGGFPQYLNRYVETLQKERTELPDELCVENHVNIGFTLSFFGDQPFNVLEPDRDQGMVSCNNTMERLLYQLGTDTDMGSWRLNLYTFIDLYKYRIHSKQDVLAFFYVNASRFERILKNIKTRKECAWWPEIVELSEIIKEVKVNGDNNRMQKG